MLYNSLALKVCLLASAALPGCSATGEAEDEPKPAALEQDESLFGLTRVWKIEICVSAENWKRMQPTQGGFPGFGPPAPGGPPVPGGQPGGFRPGSFGYEFDYVSAEVELDGEKISDVGLRFKGNGSYMLSAATHKRPFKIDFDRFVDGQKFHGLQQLIEFTRLIHRSDDEQFRREIGAILDTDKFAGPTSPALMKSV